MFCYSDGYKVEKQVKLLVTQSCPALCNLMLCSLPGSSVRGILQAEYWSG